MSIAVPLSAIVNSGGVVTMQREHGKLAIMGTWPSGRHAEWLIEMDSLSDASIEGALIVVADELGERK